MRVNRTIQSETEDRLSAENKQTKRTWGLKSLLPGVSSIEFDDWDNVCRHPSYRDSTKKENELCSDQ